MTFEEIMDKFFGSYEAADRARVEAYPQYIEAVKSRNIERAQATACEALEGCGQTKREASKDRADKRIDRFFDKF